jgi:hypothetical protein
MLNGENTGTVEPVRSFLFLTVEFARQAMQAAFPGADDDASGRLGVPSALCIGKSFVIICFCE